MPAATFRLTQEAALDLEEAVAYLAEQSIEAALQLATNLEHAFLFLAQ